jgi:hypothetical protein
MPSPKWKLVVDIGDGEEPASVPYAATTSSANCLVQHDVHSAGTDQSKTPTDISDESNFQGAPVSKASSSSPGNNETMRDNRDEDVVALLGEFMPSDPDSLLAPYMQGFMSLRLLLLRQSRTPEERDLTRTILDSFSSYTAGGRERGDIAIMLARDFMFLNHQHQQPSFLHLGDSMVSPALSASNTGLSLFGLPSTSSSLQNSPALTPIPGPGINDSLSIVSN